MPESKVLSLLSPYKFFDGGLISSVKMSSVIALTAGKSSRQDIGQRPLDMIHLFANHPNCLLMEYLVGFRERILKARELLTDVEQTAFFFVTLPEALPIAVIKRFINWFHDFGIPVGGVIVNMVIQKDQVRADSPEFVRNRSEEHTSELQSLRHLVCRLLLEKKK